MARARRVLRHPVRARERPPRAEPAGGARELRDRRGRALSARARAAAATAAALAVALAAPAATASGPLEYRALATRPGSGAGAGPLSLTRVTVGQAGRDVVFAARTKGRFDGRTLAADRKRSLCLELAETDSAAPTRQACLAPARRGALRLVLEPLDSAGRAGRARALAAEVRRTDRQSFTARFAAADAGLRRRYAWRVESTWSDRGACAPAAGGTLPCTSAVPRSGAVAARIAAVHPVGCTRGGLDPVTSVRAGRRVVALTFDDGPSPYTAGILHTLERDRVAATFFLIGQQVGGRAADARAELAGGYVIGNHSWSHPNLAGDGSFARAQLESTQAAIERATHFSPCLFRPPYGASSSALVREAADLGLTTVIWSVDPRDWSRPGTSAIISRVVGAVRPGALVLMHDGGGPRDETAAAVPVIIRTLRSRGYSFATVPELLGQSVIYGR